MGDGPWPGHMQDQAFRGGSSSVYRIQWQWHCRGGEVLRLKQESEVKVQCWTPVVQCTAASCTRPAGVQRQNRIKQLRPLQPSGGATGGSHWLSECPNLASPECIHQTVQGHSCLVQLSTRFV